jgi:hypothetical protein
MKEPRVTRAVKKNNVYYTIRWSNLKKSDKYEIITQVPEVGGIFELYYMDDYKKLNLFHFAKVWYGGLRHNIRMTTDPEVQEDPKRKEILSKRDIYYRYSLTLSNDDMDDIMFFFAQTYFDKKRATQFESSGRYNKIFIDEISDDKMINV